MTKFLILVEGQTEETFVNTILNPHLMQFDKYAVPKIITTKIVKRGNQFKGGVPHYERVRPQIIRLLNDTSAVAVSTFIDYYALPDSFPGKPTITGTTPFQRVKYLEERIAADINIHRFIPYYSLHEFEALLFSSPSTIANTLTAPEKIQQLNEIRKQFQSPEEINDHPNTCPSARLKSIFNGYQKVLYGSLISQETGLDQIRAECRHFSGWLSRLEQC